MDNQILIYKSKKKAAIITFVGLLIALVGWLFLHYADNELAGWCFLIFAFLCVVFGLGTWLDRSPQIVLTENGITEMTGNRIEIEWKAIRHVDEFFYIGQYFLRFLVDRGYKPTLLQPTWFYRFDRLYARQGVKAIFMRISFLELSSSKLERLIAAMVKADVNERARLIIKFAKYVKRPENKYANK